MSIRKAKVSFVNHVTGVGTLSPIGVRAATIPNVNMTQPYAGRGWGIRVGIEPQTTVLIQDDDSGESHVIGYIPEKKFFKTNVIEEDAAARNAPKFKELLDGEIALQSIANSVLFFDQLGNISLESAEGSGFYIHRSTDTVNQLSVSNIQITEAAVVTSGPVRRDTRTTKEKEQDVFLSSSIGYDFDRLEFTDIIGVDPEYLLSTDTDSMKASFDPETGESPLSRIAGLKDFPFTKKIVSKIKNPAITEYTVEVNEFSDGIASLNMGSLTPDQKKAGFLPPNFAARLALGTVVDEVGRISRFDYSFSSAKGHGDLWKNNANSKQESVDFKIDSKKSVRTAESLGADSHWVVSNAARFNTAIAFQLILNTRGADNKGKIPGAQPGSLWSFQVDKEGMTKWNIPAATNLNGLEQSRKGRSLLWNLDGSITQSVGIEDSQDLEKITGKGKDSKFVNTLTPRRGRSWTADFEGNIEWRLGKDTIGQSMMMEADGGLAFYYGKYTANEPSVAADSGTSGLDSPSVSGKRVGSSISGVTEGSVEFKIGTNSAQTAQSVALVTSGLMRIALGQDKTNTSLKIDSAGSMTFKVVNGGHKIELLSNQAKDAFKDGIRIQHGGPNQSLIQIDAKGVITLRNSLANSNIIMSANGDINLINITGTKISLAADGTIGIGSGLAGIDISPSSGVVLRTPGGSISLNPAGKVEIAANLGFSVTGLQAHLNTTGVLFGPGAASSPYRVAVTGGGLGMDPLTGHSESGFSLIGAIG